MPLGFWLALVLQGLILVAMIALLGRFLERALDREEDTA